MQSGDFPLDSSSFDFNTEDIDYSEQFHANFIDNTHGIHTDGDGQAHTWVIPSDLDHDGIPDYSTFEYGNVHHHPDALISQLDTTPIGQIFGHPTDDEHHWHLQTHQDTCAVVAQEFILNELGEHDGIHFSEEQLRQEASAYGLYQDGGGTPLDCVGDLLQLHGVPVEKHSECTLQDLENKLSEGENVIVAVNAEEIWNPIDTQVPLHDYFGIPGQNANHAVQVIGVDDNDPNHPMVILNDPGTHNGKGLQVPLEQFDHAWKASDHYMVSTNISPNVIT